MTSDYGALLAIDAVQTGMGRTGQWFGYEHEKIKPDVITLAKGLGGGLPIGAMVALGKAGMLFQPGSHGSTFGGNPIAAASANATISVIEAENLLSRNFMKGEWLKQALNEIEGVQEVRGSGLLLGIVLKNEISKELHQKLLDKKILVNAPTNNVIRIAPAYVVTDDQIEEFIGVFKEVIAE
jgi:acetylornithine aminotransferase